MNKRNLLTAGVAGAALLTGGGLAWWRFQPHAVVQGAEDFFWQQAWENPQGQLLAMSDFRGKPLLLNFWATWCPPCVEEMPLLNTFYNEQKANGWQVLGLAIDQAASVERFLQKLPVDFPIALAGLSGTDLGRQLGNTNGALPFTVVFDESGLVAHRKIGQVYPEDLASWL